MMKAARFEAAALDYLPVTAEQSAESVRRGDLV